MTSPGRVAVVGAGSSGITAVKNLLEAGFDDVTCFERRDVLGGLWHFMKKEAQWEDEACVNRSTVINTSKEFMSFSDFPMPANYPNFCHNTNVETYFNDYANKFGVNRYIRYNVEVMSLDKHSTFDSTGRWELRSKDHKSGEEKTEIFDFVLIATGHHGKPNWPKFPGLDKYQGKVLHSRQYKDTSGSESRNVLVVGIGNSGCDIAVELSKYNKVHLSTRRGAWVLNRLTSRGMPWDLSLHKRLRWMVARCLPEAFIQKKVKEILSERFDHDIYSLTPDHAPGATHPTVNDELPNRVAAGMVVVRPDVREFDENGVIFVDGTREDIDMVILCTGYKIQFPFIAPSVLEIRDNQVEMYKNMFLPSLRHHSIAFLALIQPLGSIFPIAEMQSRLAARVFKGEVKLPCEATMRRDIAAKQRAMGHQYVKSNRHTIQVDWLPFMDELASLAGCKPQLLKYLLTDPRLFWALLTGPGVPYQYRLDGPNPWPQARHTILTTMDRVRKPFETRKLPQKTDKSTSVTTPLLATLGAAVAVAVVYARANNIDLVHTLKLNRFVSALYV